MGLAAGVPALLSLRRRATGSRSRLPAPQPGVVRALAHTVVLGVLLAALPATSTADSATTARVLTDWGIFRCEAIRCIPARGVLSVYWSAPILYVTMDHVPMLRRHCILISARSNIWDCRRETVTRLPGSRGTADGFWEWLPVLTDGPDD
jgi:hypothetical protein